MKPKFFSYSLTPEEEATVARVGYERQLPYLGKPEMNRNYSEGDVWEVWQHSIAAGSELAFARMCGLQDFIPHVNKWKTEEDVPGFEIRYSFNGKAMRLSKWDDEQSTYVLLVDGLQHKTRRYAETNWLGEPYRAIGWATGKEIKKRGSVTQWGSWELPVESLNRMELI
jgi:hypothetical protein